MSTLSLYFYFQFPLGNGLSPHSVITTWKMYSTCDSDWNWNQMEKKSSETYLSASSFNPCFYFQLQQWLISFVRTNPRWWNFWTRRMDLRIVSYRKEFWPRNNTTKSPTGLYIRCIVNKTKHSSTCYFPNWTLDQRAPSFLKALIETDQRHIYNFIKHTGLF